MAMGLSYSEYWDGDHAQWPYVRKAFDLQTDYQNKLAYRQGLYTYEAHIRALSDALRGKGTDPQGYLDEPLPLTEKEAQEQMERAEQRRMEKQVQDFKIQAERINASIRARKE